MEQQKARQAWAVGNTVNVGGRLLSITGQLPPKRKGEAARWELQSGDGQRAYTFTPFRGLRLIRGEHVRPDKVRKRKAARRAAARGRQAPAAGGNGPRRVRAVTNKGPWRRLLALFGKRRKPRAKVTITRPPGAEIGTQQRPE